MRIRKAGKINDRLWYLGREESGVYILEGRDCSIMINGGFSFILPDVLAQMRDFEIDAQKIKKILILHSHFDHAGIAPYFRRARPDITFYASAPAWKVFAMPKAMEVMNRFSRISAKWMGVESLLDAYDMDWRGDVGGTAIGEGNRIDLGGVALGILDTPGHSHCSITAYEADEELLFASDAVGVAYRDMTFPSMNTDVNQYLHSLLKLKPLPVACVCADHYGYITGKEAAGFVDITIEEGRKWKDRFETCCRRHSGDIDAAGKEMTALFVREYPDYLIAPEILEGVFRQMMKSVAGKASDPRYFPARHEKGSNPCEDQPDDEQDFTKS
jgi:glyoxylase-like metal-dependent hydrolase (beta-lactamase superfamily II)